MVDDDCHERKHGGNATKGVFTDHHAVGPKTFSRADESPAAIRNPQPPALIDDTNEAPLFGEEGASNAHSDKKEHDSRCREGEDESSGSWG